MGAVTFGDYLVKSDHIHRANALYIVARVTNPLNKDVETRLAITKALLGYWQKDSEINPVN
jgi:hypothetical protein